MSKKTKMVATKHKAMSCSTPEHRQESPLRDDDSLCDSEASSPVPFLCTQDGAEGEVDVVWNFYTPKSDQVPKSRVKKSTQLSRKTKKALQLKEEEKLISKRRPVRATPKNTELLQDLIELNQNLHEYIARKSKSKEKQQSDEDVFSASDESPKSFRSNSRCLRRNLLSSKFTKPETETALESDDSMNECLIKASQIVEEKILTEPTPAKRSRFDQNKNKNVPLKPVVNIKMDQDSMDAILSSIKLDSPISKVKNKCDSPIINNDSFDSIFGNMNDSALDKLTQLPVKNNSTSSIKGNISKDCDWTVQEMVMHDSPAKNLFGRHNSMPESPSLTSANRPSTSGMAFGRYNSMPVRDNGNQSSVNGESPTRCTQDEIKRKHQLAREKLLAKRLLPFTTSQCNSQSLPVQALQKPSRKTQFQPRVPSSTTNKFINSNEKQNVVKNNTQLEPNEQKRPDGDNLTDLKSLIEKKRQEALLRLRKRQIQK